MNVTGIRSHLHRIMIERGIDPVPLDPWYFPSDEEYREVSLVFGRGDEGLKSKDD